MSALLDLGFRFLDQSSFLAQNPFFKILALIIPAAIVVGLLVALSRSFSVWLIGLFGDFYRLKYKMEFIFSKNTAKNINIFVFIIVCLLYLWEVIIAFMRGWVHNLGPRFGSVSDPIYLNTNAYNFYYALVSEGVLLLIAAIALASFIYRAAQPNRDRPQ